MTRTRSYGPLLALLALVLGTGAASAQQPAQPQGAQGQVTRQGSGPGQGPSDVVRSMSPVFEKNAAQRAAADRQRDERLQRTMGTICGGCTGRSGGTRRAQP